MNEGYGLICHRAIKCCCEAIGIKDLHAKVEGSTNLQNIVKAFFIGLLRQVLIFWILFFYIGISSIFYYNYIRRYML
jgi:hypothetical protein